MSIKGASGSLSRKLEMGMVAEARKLKKIVRETKKVFGLMHNYTGYPMVKFARDLVANGEIGKVRKVVVRYPQGWLATALEKTGQQQASWRTRGLRVCKEC